MNIQTTKKEKKTEKKSGKKTEKTEKNEKKLEEKQPVFECEKERRLSYKLVYDTLKYEAYLQNILDDSSFFKKFPDVRGGFVGVLGRFVKNI